MLAFRSSSSLAAAYGIAVTTTMAITTLLFFRVLVDRWGWSTPKALAVTVPLLLVDLAFLAANIPKIPHGGWFPLVVGLVLVIQMTTWRHGRDIVARTLQRGYRRTADVVAERARQRHGARAGHGDLHVQGPRLRAAGAAVEPPAQPRPARAHRLVSVLTSDAPRVDPEDRLAVTPIASGVLQVVVTFGYIDEPDVIAELRRVELDGSPARRRRGDVLHRARDRHVDPRGRDAAMARAPVRPAQPGSRQRVALLPPAVGAGVRGRHAGRHLSGRSNASGRRRYRRPLRVAPRMPPSAPVHYAKPEPERCDSRESTRTMREVRAHVG